MGLIFWITTPGIWLRLSERKKLSLAGDIYLDQDQQLTFNQAFKDDDKAPGREIYFTRFRRIRVQITMFNYN